jgi:hypothetical protein
MSLGGQRVRVSAALWLLCPLICLSSDSLRAEGDDGVRTRAADSSLPDVLTPSEWERIDHSVDRSLIWLARQQRSDGSFPTYESGQPAVTALCILAFLSDGHLPGEGPYGDAIDAGIDFVLSCQQPEGFISYMPIPAAHATNNPAHTGMYNHAIGGLLLTEVYGMLGKERSSQIRPAVEEAISVIRTKQLEPKENRLDRGGWRYIRRYNEIRSDLSVTSWQLMFCRSAKNAGFDVPAEWIDEAMAYVIRSFDHQQGIFLYALHGSDRTYSRGMVAAGTLSLSLGGRHDTPMARAAGNWLLRHPIVNYMDTVGHLDRFHYSAFYCSQAVLQLGGHYWEFFYPRLVQALLRNQSPEGHWQLEGGGDDIFGNAYTTALTVLALTAPYQLLPIFQR